MLRIFLLLLVVLPQLLGVAPPAQASHALADAASWVLNFGQHRGKTVSQVPRGYLEWLVREKVYKNRPALTAALVSLKLLDTHNQGLLPKAATPLEGVSRASNVAPRAASVDHGPQAETSLGRVSRASNVDARAASGTAPCHRETVSTQAHPGSNQRMVTLDAFFGTQAANGTEDQLSKTILRGIRGVGAEPNPLAVREVPGASLSMELITPRHAVLSGVNSVHHAGILKFLRKLPFAAFNTSARGWSIRIEDYAKVVSAMKANGLRVSSKGAAQGGKGVEGATCTDRPPDGMMKGLAAQPWPLLQSAEVQKLFLAIPRDLRSRLLPFQVEGVLFALGRGGRCLIADEMGLGKTVQAIAVAAAFHADWPLLIVCPSALRLNWANELAAWLPHEDVRVLLTGAEATAMLANATLPSITIISYDLLGQLMRHRGAASPAASVEDRWQCLILDESHYVKNAKSLRAKACLPLVLRARRAILLTGTPALSRPIELYTQVSALQPTVFGSKRAFEERFCDRRQGRFGIDVSGSSHLRELNLVLAHTLMVRRLKRDVLTQLPSKRRQKVMIQVPPRAARVLNKSMALLDGLPSRRPHALPPFSAAARARVRRDGEGDEPVLEEEGEEEEEEDGSGRSGGGGRKRALTREALLAKVYKDTGMAKLPGGLEYLLTLLEGGVEKALVFAHHLAVLDGVQEALENKGIAYVRIDGATPLRKRAEAVEHFQAAAPSVKMVAILGITAAGTGLTLTAASTIVFFELSWTPGLMMQAEDRVHRIGQRNACNIHYLLADKSVDSHMWPSIVKKLRVVAQICDGSVQAHHSLKGWAPEAAGSSGGAAPGGGARGAGELGYDTGGDVTLLGLEEQVHSGQSDLAASWLRSPPIPEAFHDCRPDDWLKSSQAFTALPGPGRPSPSSQPLDANDSFAPPWHASLTEHGHAHAPLQSQPTSLRQLPERWQGYRHGRRGHDLDRCRTQTSVPDGPTPSLEGSCSVLNLAQVDLQCPIRMELMEDPVIAMDGFTYERAAIERWFACSRNKGGLIKSPLTNEPLESKLLVPNRRLKAIIASFCDMQQLSMGEAQPHQHETD